MFKLKIQNRGIELTELEMTQRAKMYFGNSFEFLNGQRTFEKLDERMEQTGIWKYMIDI